MSQVQYSNYLFTHAGVSEVWLKNNGWNDTQNIANFINNLWETNKQAFNFTPDKFSDWSGDSKTQPPIWIRPISLIKSSDNINLHQVMGHTTQGKLRIADVKNDGSKLYYFIDTLGTSREYLLIEKGNYCYAKRY